MYKTGKVLFSPDFATGQSKYNNLIKKLSFLEDTEEYFKFFDELFERGPKIQLVGDITPSYSMLDEQVFTEIKEGLERRGFCVKVVFLMREPLERVWSMVRIGRRNRLKNRLFFLKSFSE